MPIYAACPSCGAKYPLEAAIADVEARRALAAAIKALPQEVLRRLVGYLGYHAPQGRAMAWDKTARVIDELVALIEPGNVKRGSGAPRAAPGWLWATAMDEIGAMHDEGDLSLPLKGHGLLEEICYRLAGKAEGKREAFSIARARGDTPTGYHPSHRPADVAPPRGSRPRIESEVTSQTTQAGETPALPEPTRRPISLKALIAATSCKGPLTHEPSTAQPGKAAGATGASALDRQAAELLAQADARPQLTPPTPDPGAAP